MSRPSDLYTNPKIPAYPSRPSSSSSSSSSQSHHRNVTTVDTTSAANFLFYIAIAIILALLSILAVAFAIANISTTYGKIGRQGNDGRIGPQGICLLNDTNQLFVSGNISIKQNLIMESDSSITYSNASISESINDGCLSIESTVPLCLNVLSIQSRTNTTIFDNITICFDLNCTVGFGPVHIFDNTTNTTKIFLRFFGNTSANPTFNLPFLIGNNGGYLDQLPGQKGGFLIASNPKSTGGILFDSNGAGLYGNETFMDFISFTNYITLHQFGGIRMVDLFNQTIFDFLFMSGQHVGIFVNTSDNFLIQSNRSTLVLGSLTNDTNITSVGLNLNVGKIFAENSWFHRTNLSFDLSTNSSQIGFFSNISTQDLTGWIRSNQTCNISIGPLLCIEKANVTSSLTLNNNANLIFNGGGIISNGPLSLTGPSIFIDNLLVNNINISGFLQFEFLRTRAIIVTGPGISSFNSTINANNIQVLNSLFLGFASIFNAQGVSNFGGPTTFINNVTFSPGQGNSVRCSAPLFTTNSENNPDPFACIPECLDFFRCPQLRTTSLFLRNSLFVASSSLVNNPNFSTNVQFGTTLDFISNNNSTVSTYESNANVSVSRTSNYMEISSGTYTNIISFNRTSISTIHLKDVTLIPPSCVSFFTFIGNATGIPTPFTVPIYNYTGGSTCTEMNENYYYSNTTISNNGNVFMGGAVIKRACTGSSAVVCTPFFNIVTRNFPFEELLTSGSRTLVRTNTMLDSLTQMSLANYLLNQTIGRNLTFQSATGLTFAILQSNFTVPVDTFTVDTYAYINASGNFGRIDIAASGNINIGEGALTVNPIEKSIMVPGTILGSDGNLHPCCSQNTPSVIQKFVKIRFTGTTEFSGTTGSSSISTIGFSSSINEDGGILAGFISSNLTFISPSENLYEMSSNLLITSITNITTFGCLYIKLNSNGIFHSRYFGVLYTSLSNIPNDGTAYNLNCGSVSVFLENNQMLQLQIFNLNPITSNHTSPFTFTLNTNSNVQISRT
jgi:hypothetical protein